MVKFSFEIVIIILLAFAVYYLYDHNLYLQKKITRCTDSERDTKDTLDYINKDLLNIKRVMLDNQQTQSRSQIRPQPQSQSQMRPLQSQLQSQTRPQTQVPQTQVPQTQVPQTQVPQTQVPQTQVQEQQLQPTNESESIGVSGGSLESATGMFVGDSLRNLGNILGRLPRGTVSHSSFSMNVPSSVLRGLETSETGETGQDEPTKTI